MPSDSTPSASMSQSESGNQASTFDPNCGDATTCSMVPSRWTVTLTGWDKRPAWTAHGPCCQGIDGTYILTRNLTPPAFIIPKTNYTSCIEWRSSDAVKNGSTLQGTTPPCTDVINTRRKVYISLAVDSLLTSTRWYYFLNVFHMGYINTFNTSIFTSGEILTANSSICLYPSFSLEIDAHQQCLAGSATAVPT